MVRALDFEQNIFKLLKNLNGLNPLKQLFWSELNYDQANAPISRRNFPESSKPALADDPVIFATGGTDTQFHLIYCRLAETRLL
ncbi:MAG: hypothetical protein QME64_12615, partial [bacterium]|nr:hypothetical protein [bacterium]